MNYVTMTSSTLLLIRPLMISCFIWHSNDPPRCEFRQYSGQPEKTQKLYDSKLSIHNIVPMIYTVFSGMKVVCGILYAQIDENHFPVDKQTISLVIRYFQSESISFISLITSVQLSWTITAGWVKISSCLYDQLFMFSCLFTATG